MVGSHGKPVFHFAFPPAVNEGVPVPPHPHQHLALSLFLFLFIFYLFILLFYWVRRASQAGFNVRFLDG